MKEQGRVKWFDMRNGFGFIIPDDGSPDVMLHIRTCIACAYQPDPSGMGHVEFEAEENGGKGRKAVWVGELKAQP